MSLKRIGTMAFMTDKQVARMNFRWGMTAGIFVCFILVILVNLVFGGCP